MSDPHCLQGVSEIYETTLGESIAARIDAFVHHRFHGLGPNDLIHLVKGSSHHPQKELGSYHHAIGVDCSSSASIAAYLNSLTYMLHNATSPNATNSAWFQRSHSWKIVRSTFCCYDAYSSLDIHIEARIPGTVKCYAINNQGQRVLPPDNWLTTWTSSALRTLMDDDQLQQPGIRRLDLSLYTPANLARLSEAFSLLLNKSLHLGNPTDLGPPSLTSNCLNIPILSYFHNIGRLDLIQSIAASLSLDIITIESMLLSDQQPRAVSLLHQNIQRYQNDLSSCHPFLLKQCSFLLQRKDYSRALKIARRLVEISPTDFNSWYLLCKTYMGLDQHTMALVALNACPMFSSQEKTVITMPPYFKIYYPTKGTISAASDVLDPPDEELQRLSAAQLRGTFQLAYDALCQIVKKIGWDALLTLRASAFMMEEEYHSGEIQKEKRLCERWLDNLFMLLYEDLRIMNIWKAEAAVLAQQNVEYKRTAAEWEILGNLAMRLYCMPEAKEAYQKALESKKSPMSQRIMQILVQIYIEEGKIAHALSILLCLADFHYVRYQSARSTCVPFRLWNSMVQQYGIEAVKKALNVVSDQASEGARRWMEQLESLAKDINKM